MDKNQYANPQNPPSQPFYPHQRRSPSAPRLAQGGRARCRNFKADGYMTSALMSSVSDNTLTLTSCSPSAIEPQCMAKCSNCTSGRNLDETPITTSSTLSR